MSAPAVTLRELTIRYASAAENVSPINSFSAEIAAGSMTLLLGPSGCGKTSLLSALAGLLRPTSGTIFVGEDQLTSMTRPQLDDFRRNRVGIVFQAFNLVPSLSATENVMVPMRAAGIGSKDARRRAVDLLRTVGLGERLGVKPSQLSGGQQQRVAIARALANDPPLVLADEPTASLDGTQVDVVRSLLRDVVGRGHTVIVATHDHRLLDLADQVIDLSEAAVTR